MKVNFIQVGQSKVKVIYIICLSLILHALHLFEFVATGIGTTGLGIGRALAIDIETHAFNLYLAWYRLHMSATSGLYSSLFAAVSVNNLNMDGCVLQVDRLLAIENIFSELPSCTCGKWLAH